MESTTAEVPVTTAVVLRPRVAPTAPPTAPSGEAVPAQTPPPDLWTFAAEFSFTDQSGNKTLRLLTGGLKFSHRDKQRFELDGSLQSRYGQSEGEVAVQAALVERSPPLPKDAQLPLVDLHAHDPTVEREIALIKVHAPKSARAELVALAAIFEARTVDVGPNSMIFEVTGEAIPQTDQV